MVRLGADHMGTVTHRSAPVVRGTDDIACVEFVDATSLYLDGDLTEQEAAAFTEHLVQCVDCRAHTSQFQATIALLAVGRAAQLTPNVRDRILDSFRCFEQGG